MHEVPLSLYIHVPWCLKKCPYCDFNSHQGTVHAQDYLSAVTRDLQSKIQLAGGRSIQSVYVGGGTPNLLSPDFYHALLTNIHQHYSLTPSCEITLEVNPGEGRIHDFIGYWQAGINRLSIGVQTFDDRLLERIGRDYTNTQAHYCLEQAQLSPIDNINIDLMFALPGQTYEQAINDLNLAFDHQPQHLSLYELTIEPNTTFHAHPPAGLPSTDNAACIYQQFKINAQQHGYHHYEIAAYARKGKESIHNTNYWTFGDYIGIGAGAHGKVSTGASEIFRYHNHKVPEKYMQADETMASRHLLHQEDIFIEWCLNSFRLVQGVDIEQACHHTGFNKQQLLAMLSPCIEHCIIDTKTIRLTEYAYMHQNSLLEKIYRQ